MVTATNLASYSYCPRKLYLSSILLVKEPEKKELVLGSIWHSTFEMINKKEESIVVKLPNSNYIENFEIYRRELAKFLRDSIIKYKSKLKEFEISMTKVFEDYWPNIEDEAKKRALNVSNFMKKSGFIGKELWENLEPKILSEQYFKSVDLNLSGVIDVIEVHKDLWVPVELKTGKAPRDGLWEGHKLQLGAYILMLENLGKKTSEGVLRYIGQEDRLLHMNSMLKEEILEVVARTANVLNSKEIPSYTDNKHKCTSCSLKEICYNDEEIKKLMNTYLEKITK